MPSPGTGAQQASDVIEAEPGSERTAIDQSESPRDAAFGDLVVEVAHSRDDGFMAAVTDSGSIRPPSRASAIRSLAVSVVAYGGTSIAKCAQSVSGQGRVAETVVEVEALLGGKFFAPQCR